MAPQALKERRATGRARARAVRRGSPARHAASLAPLDVARVPEKEDRLYGRIALILDEARSRVARTVNTAIVHAYWLVGREIVEVEQGGVRAGYGDELLRTLAPRLARQFGKGST